MSKNDLFQLGVRVEIVEEAEKIAEDEGGTRNPPSLMFFCFF